MQGKQEEKKKDQNAMECKKKPFNIFYHEEMGLEPCLVGSMANSKKFNKKTPKKILQ